MLDDSAKCEIEDVFKLGKTVCSGYARLFRHFADNIKLTAENIMGYAKCISDDSDIKKLEKKLDSNHEYNAVKLNNKWYLIDSTWGAGHISHGVFKKQFNPYYFCIAPELLINSHYPVNDDWQLLEKPLTYKEFLANLFLGSDFLADGFNKVEPDKGRNNCSIGKNKLILYKNNKKEIQLSIIIKKWEENPDPNELYYKIGDKKYSKYCEKDAHLNKEDNNYEYEFDLKEKGEYCLECNGKDTPGITGVYKPYFTMYFNCS